MSVLSITQSGPGPSVRSLEGLRALILFGGSVWVGKLVECTGRPIFDLPLEAGCSILDCWRRAAMSIGPLAGVGTLPVRVMINRSAPERRPIADGNEAGRPPMAPVQVEWDPFDYRGTGGMLRDLAVEYADDDLLLVANAAQILTEPLAGLAVELAEAGGDVNIISHLDGTPSGLALVRCGALRHLPGSGFVDLKEQALPMIAQRFDVNVVHRRRPTGLPVRTLDQYIEGLRHHHKALAGKAVPVSAFEEDWEPSFAIIEEGATVDPSARLHDAVVLRDGRVEARSCLVHSLVCPGGVLRRGQSRVDAYVTAEAQSGNGNDPRE